MNTRAKFLHIATGLPADIVSVILEYDAHAKDRYTARIVRNISSYFRKYWTLRHDQYMDHLWLGGICYRFGIYDAILKCSLMLDILPQNDDPLALQIFL